MNLINDGHYLELSFDNYSRFSSIIEQRKALETVENCDLPLRIILNPNKELGPVETDLFRKVIHINQKKAGRLLISSLPNSTKIAS